MTSNELMKKIGLGKDKPEAAENTGKFKTQMLKHLKDGKNKIARLEREILGGKNHRMLLDQNGAVEKREAPRGQTKF